MNNFNSITPSKIRFGKYISISFMISFVVSPFLLAFALSSSWFYVTVATSEGVNQYQFLKDGVTFQLNGTQSTTASYAELHLPHVELLVHTSFVLVVMGWVFGMFHVLSIIVGIALSRYNVSRNTTSYWSVLYVRIKKPLYLGTLFVGIICILLGVLIYIGLPSALKSDGCYIFVSDVCTRFIGSTANAKWGPDFAWVFALIFTGLEVVIFGVLYGAENWRNDVMLDYNDSLLDSEYTTESYTESESETSDSEL